MNRIYADHAATTKMSQAAIDAMLVAIRENYGNPSSLHQACLLYTSTAWLCILASTVRKALKGTSSLGRAYRELPAGERRMYRSQVERRRNCVFLK